MRRVALGLAAGILLLIGAAAADGPRVTAQAVSRLEGQIDSLFAKGPTPCDILGNTRGVYLDGYGEVFTSLLSLAPTPTPNPFRTFTSKDVMDIHARKVKQVPVLREKMRDTLLAMAASPALEGVRGDEQIVCGVSLFYYSWEDTNGLPAQIVMQGAKRKLLDVQAGRVPRAQLDAIVKVQEL
jgi:hypothetical protein